MTPCPACETAAVNPNTGIYYASCSGCELRAARQSPTYHAHMQNLKRTPGSSDRRAYVEAVERNEGHYIADVIRKDYATWWEEQRKVKA